MIFNNRRRKIHRLRCVYSLFQFLDLEYTYKWNHITYVPEYKALGLPVVAQRKENWQQISDTKRKGCPPDLTSGACVCGSLRKSVFKRGAFSIAHEYLL
jgi:hypothetical protein